MAAPVSEFDRLPDNILLDILSYLSVKDRCISGRVCRRWRKILMDNTLWRHVNLLPYQLDLRKMWKFVRAHLSEQLKTLKIRGCPDPKTNEVKPPLSESMVEDLKGRCPSLYWLHIEPGNVTNLSSAALLPSSLTHLTLLKNTWQPRWLKDCGAALPNLIYLDLSETVRIDNQDVKDIAEFTKLQTLKLDGCYRLSEQGLQEIPKALTSLTSLSLSKCNTTDLVAHHIGRNLKELRELDLSYSKSLTSSSLPALAEGLTKLEYLNLDWCMHLTLHHIPGLAKSKSLRKLSLVAENFLWPDFEIEPYRAMMPDCELNV
ncbi:hypothetical protein BaRGS_00016787 [Batillaria attramentaria]|uniref:F-box domain-containing protein n=1 Tax=Batillaria attramentaria TaxID=370345 RepID=A0ABD0KXZ4_9CAEN